MSLPQPVVQYQENHIHDNKKPDIIVASAICLSAAYVSVVFRFLARRLSKACIGPDDWVIVLALVFTSAFVATALVGVYYGLGKHLILVTDGFAFGKSILAAEVLYNPAIAATKSSILLLYGRIFPGKRFHSVLWTVAIFVLCYSVTSMMVNIFQCVPVQADWDPTKEPRCVNLDAELIIISSINVITDVLTLCLPMPLVWKLHASKARKYQISGLFLLGGFVCVISIVRATYVSKVSLTDGSWADTNGAIWSIVETCIAVVSACLPTLRPLYNHVVHGDVAASSTPKAVSYQNGSDNSGKDGVELQNLRPGAPISSKGRDLSSTGEVRSFTKLTNSEDLEGGW